MGGGLIQIVSYGAQDLFLTGNPEITFFKVVYRRHTNFSIESRKLTFEDLVGFGKSSSLIFPKIGDLINNIYLKVTLPEINFKRDDFNNDLELELAEAISDYNIIKEFMLINIEAYRLALDEYDAINTTQSQNMKEVINNVFIPPDDPTRNLLVIQNYETLVNGDGFDASGSNMDVIASGFMDDDPKDDLKSALDVGYQKSIEIQKYYSDLVISLESQNEEQSNDNLKFAWVDRIGHAILDSVEIDIGGYCVDKQYGDWLNIWYELSGNKYQKDIYDKMIGNVSKLTTFDRSIKSPYDLYIPLQFWFNRRNGLALPLISLQHQDVTLKTKFRNLEDCSYIEDQKQIIVDVNNLETSERLFLNEAVENLDIDIEVSVFVDYVYLDRQERKLFAQSSHEYLIEQVQRTTFKDINFNKESFLLDFFHPCKEIIWVAQQRKYTENIDGWTKLRWDNYTISDNNEGNIIKNAEVIMNSYVRVEKKNGNYFNYVQPWQCHRNTPSDGINVYSFSLFPEEFQPSGSANFTKLTRVTLNLEFDESFFPELADPEELELRVYATNYNILRFVGGMAGCAYIC